MSDRVAELRAMFGTLRNVLAVVMDAETPPELVTAARAGTDILESLAVNMQRIADAQEEMAKAYLDIAYPTHTLVEGQPLPRGATVTK